MARFLAGRILQGIAIVWLVATLTFILMRLAPGDPFVTMMELSSTSPDFIAQARRNAGLDRPIHEQYLLYVSNLARGDLGLSFAERRPVADMIRERMPETLSLALTALVLMFALGILVGAFQGARAPSKTDDALSVITLVLYSVPVFWLGMMLLYVFAEQLHWLPSAGSRDPVLIYDQLSYAGRLVDRARHLLLPAAALALVGAAGTARYQRAAMLDVIRQDFVRSARAKGLTEHAVVFRHALRNALLPIITIFGLSFPILLSGAVLVENVFAWPGLGRLLVDAIFERDYHVVTGTAIVAATLVVVGNFLADLLYRTVDPRTRAW